MEKLVPITQSQLDKFILITQMEKFVLVTKTEWDKFLLVTHGVLSNLIWDLTLRVHQGLDDLRDIKVIHPLLKLFFKNIMQFLLSSSSFLFESFKYFFLFRAQAGQANEKSHINSKRTSNIALKLRNRQVHSCLKNKFSQPKESSVFTQSRK